MLAYDDQGSGPPLVFLHGITCDMAHWELVVSLLVDDFRCVRMDLPGHGATGGEGADLFGQATAVQEVVEHLGLERPVLIGHSAGGFTSLIYGLVHGARGLVIVDQPLDVVRFGGRVVAYRDRLFDPDQFPAAFAEFIEHFRGDLVPEDRQALLNEHINPRQDVVLKMWEQLLEGDPTEVQQQLEAALPNLAAPSLHLYTTEWDERERELTALIPNSTVEVWEGHGHFVMLEDPDRLAARIRDFTTSL